MLGFTKKIVKVSLLQLRAGKAFANYYKNCKQFLETELHINIIASKQLSLSNANNFSEYTSIGIPFHDKRIPRDLNTYTRKMKFIYIFNYLNNYLMLIFTIVRN